LYMNNKYPQMNFDDLMPWHKRASASGNEQKSF
jgi:hypothetical protein